MLATKTGGITRFGQCMAQKMAYNHQALSVVAIDLQPMCLCICRTLDANFVVEVVMPMGAVHRSLSKLKLGCW